LIRKAHTQEEKKQDREREREREEERVWVSGGTWLAQRKGRLGWLRWNRQLFSSYHPDQDFTYHTTQIKKKR
jgi:hypothetical protein